MYLFEIKRNEIWYAGAVTLGVALCCASTWSRSQWGCRDRRDAMTNRMILLAPLVLAFVTSVTASADKIPLGKYNWTMIIYSPLYHTTSYITNNYPETPKHPGGIHTHTHHENINLISTYHSRYTTTLRYILHCIHACECVCTTLHT